jgi:hypothetical protein
MRVSEALLWASAAVAIVSAVALEAAVVVSHCGEKLPHSQPVQILDGQPLTSHLS